MWWPNCKYIYQHLHDFTIFKVVSQSIYISSVIGNISPDMNNTPMLPGIFAKYHSPSYFVWKMHLFIKFKLILKLKWLDISHHIFIVIWCLIHLQHFEIFSILHSWLCMVVFRSLIFPSGTNINHLECLDMLWPYNEPNYPRYIYAIELINHMKWSYPFVDLCWNFIF
jgi:hypothetical protein